MKEQVLQAMREAGKPVSAGDVTKALGLGYHTSPLLTF